MLDNAAGKGPARLISASMVVCALLLIVAIALPWLNRYPAPTGVTRCASNMHQIGIAVIVYAASHGGRFPADLDSLVHEDHDLHTTVFLCPATDVTIEATPNNRVAFAKLKSAGRISYIYVGELLTVHSDSDNVVLYEPPSNHGDGMYVLFADGHVKWLTALEAQSILNQAALGVRPIRYPPAPATAPTTRG